MTYRDSFEQCPRCHVTLVDARAARACEQCGGLWVEEPVLSEMVLTMLPPQPHGRLLLAVMQRAGEKLPCPTCGEAMHPTEIHGVELDRCAKHGIWFDKPELELALRRVADPALPPPLAAAGVALEIEHAGMPPLLTFTYSSPGEPVRTVQVRQPAVKLGRLKTAHVALTDPNVARMHALIDCSDARKVKLIDLGSGQGTLVNGQRFLVAYLHSGDTIQIGATTLTVAIDP